MLELLLACSYKYRISGTVRSIGRCKNHCEYGKKTFLKDLLEVSGVLGSIPRGYPRGENKVCVWARCVYKMTELLFKNITFTFLRLYVSSRVGAGRWVKLCRAYRLNQSQMLN